MILVKPSFEFIILYHSAMFDRIETAGRTCYKSKDKITEDSAIKFIERIIKSGHESVLEHESISVRFIVDRGVSHEMVRHRLAAYSQESTRYCNYSGGVTFIIPPWVNIEPGTYDINFVPDALFSDTDWIWYLDMATSEKAYLTLLQKDWSPQQARSVLPNSLKTEIVMTANLREWRHVLRLRTAKAAHPQMREIMLPLLHAFQTEIPVIFDDIKGDNHGEKV